MKLAYNEFILEKTAYDSIRLWLSRKFMDHNNTNRDNIVFCFDKLSVWGGCDKIDETYISWEFNPKDKEIIERVIRRCGFTEYSI